jgi:hypothetical protein
MSWILNSTGLLQIGGKQVDIDALRKFEDTSESFEFAYCLDS